MTTNQNEKGYYHLAKAVIWQCFTNPYIEPARLSKYRIDRSNAEADERKKIRIEFAKNSRLIHHFANVGNYDEVRIRRRIIEYNSLPKEELLKKYNKFLCHSIKPSTNKKLKSGL